MLPNTIRPSSTAATMVAKLSSSSVMPAASLLTSVPGDAHGDTDVGLLQRRRVVDAIAGHGGHLAPLLPGGDDTKLVGGRHARVHGDVSHIAFEIGVAHRLELAAGYHAAVGQHPDLPRHSGRRQRMIAGDHHRADACGLAGPHGRACLGPRRIHHRDKTQQGHARFRLLDRRARFRGNG